LNDTKLCDKSSSAQQHSSTAAQQHSSTAAQQHSSTAAQQHSSTAAQQHSSIAAQQHSSTAAQQHSSTAAQKQKEKGFRVRGCIRACHSHLSLELTCSAAQSLLQLENVQPLMQSLMQWE